MIPTAADLREHEAHRDHPAPLTGRCNVGACRRFPIQGHGASPRRPGYQAPGTVPWAVADPGEAKAPPKDPPEEPKP